MPQLVSIGMGGWFWTSTLKELPVFEPNDFFWKNYWREGKEEKWEAFARAVQEIIAEASGLEVSNCTLEDKNEYKSLMQNGLKKSS